MHSFALEYDYIQLYTFLFIYRHSCVFICIFFAFIYTFLCINMRVNAFIDTLKFSLHFTANL